MQMQSDISGIEVIRSQNAEATAAGAAFLAGLAVGFFRDREEIKSLMANGGRFSPQIDETDRAKRLEGWRRAIRACREFCKEK